MSLLPQAPSTEPLRVAHRERPRRSAPLATILVVAVALLGAGLFLVAAVAEILIAAMQTIGAEGR